MYQVHAVEIQNECRHSVSAFVDVLAFVLATIQESQIPWYKSVQKQRDDDAKRAHKGRTMDHVRR